IALLAPRRSGGGLRLRGRVRKAVGRRLRALRGIAKVAGALGCGRKAIERQRMRLLRRLRGKARTPVAVGSSLRKLVPLRGGLPIARLLLALTVTVSRWPMRRWLRHRLVRHRTPCCRPHPSLPDRTAPRHVRNPLSRTPSTLRRIATLSHLLGSVYANNRQARGQNLCIGADERKACRCQFPVMSLDKAQMWRFIDFRPLAVVS